MIDTITGQQTETTLLFERRVMQRMRRSLIRSSSSCRSRPPNLAQAQYLLTGTIARVPTAPLGRPTVRLNLALTDLRTGIVVAQGSALAPRSSSTRRRRATTATVPVLIKDKVVEGYAKTTTTTPGQRADAYYLERIGAASVISEATTLYNAEKYQDALGQYRSALLTAQGEQLRVQSGIYLTSMKLGNMAEAEQAFGRIVALGIAYNELGVKFLFNPRSVDFWSDPKISGAYGMWLRQIARRGDGGKELHRDRRPHQPQRSGTGQRRAVAEARAVRAPASRRRGVGARRRTRAEGMGFRQNIVGSGTDDGFDVLDRRVEFRIVPCA